MKKTYVIDTNVILYDSDCIYKFEEHAVVIPITVVEELDNFKKEQNELGRNARQFARNIEELRGKSPLHTKQPVNSVGGTIRIELYHSNMALPEMDMNIADNRILAVAAAVKGIVVSKDTNLRIKADALVIRAEDYENSKVDFDDLYSGISHGAFPAEGSEVANQFTVLEDGSIYRWDAKLGQHVALGDTPKPWGLEPRNVEQQCALDLLLNDDIKLVTLVGKAGTGKTLVAIAAGLQQVTDDFTYRKMLVSRPVMPMGKDLGFLPGTVDEKLAPYMQPIYDNIEYLMSGYSITAKSTYGKPSITKVKGTGKGKKKKTEYSEDSYCEKGEGLFSKGYMELINAGIIEVEPLTYIRGRSIPQQYMIVDEAANLTPHEVKTIITRAGEGTKIVLTGDPNQIDAPYIDASSNGLTYIVNKMKGNSIYGHVTLTKGERSELAELASNLL